MQNEVGGCRLDSDCSGRRRCSHGSCAFVAGCSKDGHCRYGEQCSGSSLLQLLSPGEYCVKDECERRGCETDRHCGAGRRCRNRRCRL